MLSKCAAAIFSLTALYAQGQFANSYKGLPKQYTKTAQDYLFPINPNKQNYLAGTMGELRTTHLHSGIDIRTNKQVGKPVLAAQDGYVSRIGVSPKGYGNVLYITHQNGYTTVYAHLQRFRKELARYIREEQYKIQSFRIKLVPQKGRWRVRQGDTIGYSGNSGSSGGPHLHFDIRNSDNEALNPLRFGFEEIIDNTSPVALKIAFQTMDMYSRINNRFGRFEFSLIKEEDHYTLPSPIFATGNIGIEILAHDEMSNSAFRCGINYIETWVEGKKIFNQSIEKINFSTTRSVLALVHYESLWRKGQFFNKLYVSDGNDLSGYHDGTIKRGIVKIEDTEKSVKVILKDAYANQSEVNFSIQPSQLLQKIPDITPTERFSFYSTNENTLVVSSKKEASDTANKAQVFYNNALLSIPPAYSDSKQNFFLIDMRKILPDSMAMGEEMMYFDFRDIIPSKSSYEYHGDYLNIKFGANALYDTVFLRTQYHHGEQEIFSIGPAFYPLKNSITITLKPTEQYTKTASVYEIVDKSYKYKGGDWKDNQLSFSTREFGDYTIMVDDIPPTITQIVMHNEGIRFKIEDSLSGIATYSASIDGRWLLMQYDPKTGILKTSSQDALKPPLKGVFLLEVADYAGNKNRYKSTIP